MHFREFIYNHAPSISLSLPKDIIQGKIEDVLYRNNPIQIVIRTDDGKRATASFTNRYVYDYVVGKQRPSKGKKIYMNLDGNGSIMHVKIF